MGRHHRSPWTNTLFCFAVSISIGIAVIFALSLLFSALTYFILGTMQFTAVFSYCSLAAGSSVSGYICGRYRRRRGLIAGLICGTILAAFLIFSAVLAAGELPSPLKPALMAALSAAGGVSGVNSPRPRNLM